MLNATGCMSSQSGGDHARLSEITSSAFSDPHRDLVRWCLIRMTFEVSVIEDLPSLGRLDVPPNHLPADVIFTLLKTRLSSHMHLPLFKFDYRRDPTSTIGSRARYRLNSEIFPAAAESQSPTLTRHCTGPSDADCTPPPARRRLASRGTTDDTSNKASKFATMGDEGMMNEYIVNSVL